MSGTHVELTYRHNDAQLSSSHAKARLDVSKAKKQIRTRNVAVDRIAFFNIRPPMAENICRTADHIK